ncbi:FecR family protein [Hymenobacter sp. BT491]|uniref:FecR family protein n=1 Tax=Hymenobacter sp. BT491 TaxID=2766779 RepID=UPI001653B164|nr:FecR domain-containing protein [Hymenobacter sp. BT491]MBC6990924.1 FecR domain-containing protein [Hymenobacter sp. BT491]
MTEAEFHNLLQRYLDGRCTPEERVLVEHWYDRLDDFEGKALQSQNQEAVEDAIWQRLKQTQVDAEAKPRLLRHPAAFWQTAGFQWAAALVLFALGLGVLLPYAKRLQAPSSGSAVASHHGWTRRYNTTQQVQAFQLPDGSHITLHPGSSLRYATAFGGPRREVYLEGEAFFKVSKNRARPFLVFTKQVVTTVLGTSFRVKAYSGSKEASVAVQEGKVAVQPRKNARLDATPANPAAAGVLLLPNQQVVYSVAKHHLKKELVDKPVVLAPQSFEFEERPVAEVLTALEKAYGVDIVYDQAKLAGCTVSITFYDEPLFEKLGLLCKSLGAYYSLSEAQIIIHSNGCQPEPGS